MTERARDPRLDDLVARTEGFQPWRRLLHVVGGSCVAWLAYVLAPTPGVTRWLFGIALALTFVVDILRLRLDGLNVACFRVFSPLLRPREADELSLTWFMLGVFVAISFPIRSVAVPSLLVLSWADPAAALVGRRWGTTPIGKGTLEGSAAFAVVGTLVLLPFASVAAPLIALLTAVAEAHTRRVDDNAVIPFVVACCLLGLQGIS